MSANAMNVRTGYQKKFKSVKLGPGKNEFGRWLMIEKVKNAKAKINKPPSIIAKCLISFIFHLYSFHEVKI